MLDKSCSGWPNLVLQLNLKFFLCHKSLSFEILRWNKTSQTGSLFGARVIKLLAVTKGPS